MPVGHLAVGGLALALLGLGALATAPAAGQEVREIDDGRFEILINGRRVGTETFAVRQEGNQVRAVGRIVLDDGAGSGSTDTRLQLDTGFRPSGYGYRSTAGSPGAVDAAWSGDRLRIHITGEEGERWKEFVTRGPTAILERGVAHHHGLLLRQLGPPDEGATIGVIVPSEGLQASATVTERENATVQVGPETRSAVRYRLEVDGTAHLVWVDAEGRVLRVEVPDLARVARRLPREAS